MNALWPDTFVEESNPGQHVFQLRKALGESEGKVLHRDRFRVTVSATRIRFTQTVRALPIEDKGDRCGKPFRVADRVAVEGQSPPSQSPFRNGGIAKTANAGQLLLFSNSRNRSPKTDSSCGRAAGHQQFPGRVEELHRCFNRGESIWVVAHLDGLPDCLRLGECAVEGDEGSCCRGVSATTLKAPYAVARTAFGRKEQGIVCSLRHGASAVEGQQRLKGGTEGISRIAVPLSNLNLPGSLQFLTSRNGRLCRCASDGQKESGQNGERIKRLGEMQCHGASP